ncbi:MAG: DUF3800 domain-containing protein [Nitrosopumilus sp.]|nr:DUF3800 domain-containing protein [Nitrosopumilus sp.]
MTHYTLFVDESGDHGKLEMGSNRKDALFFGAGLAISDDSVKTLDDEYNVTLDGIRAPLHFSDIISRRNAFESLSEKESKTLIEKACIVINKTEGHLFATVLDKPLYEQYYSDGVLVDPHTVTWNHMIGRFAKFLKQNDHTGDVIYHHRDPRFNNAFEKSVIEYGDSPFTPSYFGPDLKLIKKIIPSYSHTKGIQLADMCCGIIRHRYIYSKSDFQQLIRNRFYKKEKDTTTLEEPTGKTLFKWLEDVDRQEQRDHEPRWFPPIQLKKIAKTWNRITVCPRGSENSQYEKIIEIFEKYKSDNSFKEKRIALVKSNNKIDVYAEIENKTKQKHKVRDITWKLIVSLNLR